MDQPELEALHSTLHRLETRWHTGGVDNSIYHAWDPLPFWDFFSGLRVAADAAAGKSFLDVGCGIGTKLALASHLGYDVSGIERHGPYVESARELVPGARVTHADAFNIINFQADIVYMYRPCREDALQEDLERHVIGHLRPGTVLFLPVRRPSFLWRPIGDSHVWVI